MTMWHDTMCNCNGSSRLIWQRPVAVDCLGKPQSQPLISHEAGLGFLMALLLATGHETGLMVWARRQGISQRSCTVVSMLTSLQKMRGIHYAVCSGVKPRPTSNDDGPRFAREGENYTCMSFVKFLILHHSYKFLVKSILASHTPILVEGVPGDAEVILVWRRAGLNYPIGRASIRVVKGMETGRAASSALQGSDSQLFVPQQRDHTFTREEFTTNLWDKVLHFSRCSDHLILADPPCPTQHRLFRDLVVFVAC